MATVSHRRPAGVRRADRRNAAWQVRHDRTLELRMVWRERLRSRPTGALAVLGLVLGLTTAGTGAVLLQRSAQADRPLGTVPARPAPAAPAAPAVAAAAPATVPRAAPTGQAQPVFVPQRLEVGKLGISAPVVPVTVSAGGALEVPPNPAVLGWWAAGARPGGRAGSIVIDGHVDSAALGPGAFFRLSSLVPGDRLVVAGGAARQAYTVAAVRRYAKSSLPSSVFDQQLASRLVLITCGGSFNTATRHYSDNVVVFAVPAR